MVNASKIIKNEVPVNIFRKPPTLDKVEVGLISCNEASLNERAKFMPNFFASFFFFVDVYTPFLLYSLFFEDVCAPK